MQVVQTVKTDTFSYSGSTNYQDITGLSASITPSSTSSKVIILVTLGMVDANADCVLTAQLDRGGTAIFIGDAAGSRTRGSINYRVEPQYHPVPLPITYMDSPATTSSTTYKVQMRAFTSTDTFYINRATTDGDGDSALRSRCASSIILMEVGP